MKHSNLWIFISLAFLSLNNVTLVAQSFAEIVFEEKIINLGEVDSNIKPEYYLEFNFENTGNALLVINQIKASCGCTKPEFPTHPIKPGEKGKIKVKFVLGKDEGYFSKHLIVDSNGKEDVIMLRIKGEIKNANQ